jgi:hypothetical protein
MNRKLYVTVLLLQYRVLSIWPPSDTPQLKNHEDFVISADALLSDDYEEETLYGEHKDSLYLDLNNSKSESHNQLTQNESSTSLGGKIKIPILEEPQDMEEISLNMWYWNH